MRVFLPVNVFISTSQSPARCINQTVSEVVTNAGTFAYRFFGYFGYYFWY